jgi:hypothetical protein
LSKKPIAPLPLMNMSIISAGSISLDSTFNIFFHFHHLICEVRGKEQIHYVQLTLPMMGVNPLQGPLEGVGSGNRDIVGLSNGNMRSSCT